MGTALTRLFAQSKYNGRYDGTDAMEIIECDRAQDKIHCILATHGEALIAALERVEDEFHCCCYDLGKTCIVCDSVALLAQLESEAQP